MKNLKLILVFALCSMLHALCSSAALTIDSGPVSNVTRVAADVYGNLSATNGTTNTVNVLLYYGTTDSTTNAGSWGFSNAYGVVTNTGILATNLSGLTPATRYYYRWYVYEGTNTDWASTSNFTTTAGAPTNQPAASNVVVMVSSNGTLRSPTNFFGANTNLIDAAGVAMDSEIAVLVQSWTAGTGLTNSGTATNPTGALNAASVASLALADSATQPGDDWTNTIASMSAADVTNGAAKGATALQDASAFATAAQGVSATDALARVSVLETNTATAAQGSNADTAYGWGDHALPGYATLAGDQVFTGSNAFDGSVFTRFGTSTFIEGNLGVISSEHTVGPAGNYIDLLNHQLQSTNGSVILDWGLGTLSLTATGGTEIVNYNVLEAHAVNLGGGTNWSAVLLDGPLNGNAQTISNLHIIAISANVDSGNLYTNTVGGKLTILGDKVQSGNASSATGTSSHAEGRGTTASGFASHSEGDYSLASAQAAHAEGRQTAATGEYSHAEGNYTTASAESSHAEGTSTTASGSRSHAEGSGSIASATAAHAEGYDSQANGIAAHAEGMNTTAAGDCSHAAGQGMVVLATNSFGWSDGTPATNSTPSNFTVYAQSIDFHCPAVRTHGTNYIYYADSTNYVAMWADVSAYYLQAVSNGTAAAVKTNALW